MTPARVPPAHGDALPAPPGVVLAPSGTSDAAVPRAMSGVATAPFGTPGVAMERVAWSLCSAGREGRRGTGLRGGEAAAR
jgi:hypothetical protein